MKNLLRNKLFWIAVALALVLIVLILCLAKCDPKQNDPAAPVPTVAAGDSSNDLPASEPADPTQPSETVGLGPQVTLEEEPAEDAFIKDEDAGEQDDVIDFDDKKEPEETTESGSGTENTEDAAPEETLPDAPATEPDTSTGFGDFF